MFIKDKCNNYYNISKRGEINKKTNQNTSLKLI